MAEEGAALLHPSGAAVHARSCGGLRCLCAPLLAVLVTLGLLRSTFRPPLANQGLRASMLFQEGTCAHFECPDGFQLKDNAFKIFGSRRPGVCCDESLCSCSREPNSSKFSCNFEVAQSDCGEGWRCAMDPNKTWRYSMDRYSACRRTLPLGPSKAPLVSFYIYRSDAPNRTFLDGMEAANAIGQIMRLHLEIVPYPLPREGQGDVTVIRRLKVTIRPTRPLLQRRMHFGQLETIDDGRCEGFVWKARGYCAPHREKYGSVVGCEYLFGWPRWNWQDPTGGQLVKEVIWYSLPGPCSDRVVAERDSECMKRDPGGRCVGFPSGAAHCSYSVEPAGEIGINELAGIQDYEAFYREGGREYDPHTDRGVHTSFWDHIHDAEAARKRAQVMVSMFTEKFGAEHLDEAFCDYKYDRQDVCPQAEAVGHDIWGNDVTEIFGC